MADRPDHNTGSSDSQDTQDSQGETGSRPSAGISFSQAALLDLPKFIDWAITDGNIYDGAEWGTPIFGFVRLVRSWFKEEIKADRAFDRVDAIMRKSGGWDTFFGLDDEEAYAQFVDTWSKIRWRVDESPLDIAAKRAKSFPLASHVKRARPTPGYNRFFSLVGWLQFTMGTEANIYLPVREIGHCLGADIKMVSIWRQWAIDDGFIEEVAPHNFKARRATEFRVKPGHHAWLKDLIKKKL